MSGPAVRAELQLTLNDGATAGLKRITDAAEKSAKKVADTSTDAAKRSASETEASTSRQRSSYEKLSRAREVLGVRSERVIQREIQQTEAAYKRLESSGQVSSDALARAADKTREKITKLTNEMGKLTAEQKKAAASAAELEKQQAKLEQVQTRLRYGVAGVAGVGAAAYTLKAPAMEAMAYDRILANMANTAYAERDLAGRKIGMRSLEDAVNRARRFGGGTRESAASALDTMISSGVVSVQDSMQMLPGIMKAATAGNTEATALATIAIRAQQSFKIAPDKLPGVLSGALAAGQAGGFELKDMAKWLPQQMAMAGNLGMSGRNDFANLAAWNQASIITAGSKDEAGNNLRDLLNELNTPHFKQFLASQYLHNGARLKPGERQFDTKAIDRMFLNYQSRGIDKVSATMDIMGKVFAKDKDYQALQKKLAGAGSNDERRAILEAMSAQMQGSAIGKVFHNQQSLMAFLGILNNQAYTQDVRKKVRAEYDSPEGLNAVSVAQALIESTSSYKLEQANEDKKMAEKSAIDNLTPAIGRAAGLFSDLASKFPLMTGSTVLATTSLTALAGAAGLASIAMGAKPGGAIANAALKYGPMASRAGNFAGKALGLGAAWEVGHDLVGRPLARGIDGLVQMGTGDKNATLGGWLYDLLHSDVLKPAEAPKMKADVNISVGDDRVLVKSTKLDATGMDANFNTGSLWSTP